MININIISNNKAWYRYIPNPNKLIGEKICNINKKFNKFKKKKIFFTLLLSGENEIRKLNKNFRKKNQSTDVLSFPFYTKKDLKKKLLQEKEIYIGDIIINLTKIKNKNDNKYFKMELDKLWIHGLVHLFGYDHKKDKDFSKMLKVEKKFLSFINK